MGNSIKNHVLIHKTAVFVLLGLVWILCGIWFGVQPAAAADLTMAGAPLSGTSVDGGCTTDISNGFKFYYQVYGDRTSNEVYISGYSIDYTTYNALNSNTKGRLQLPAQIQEPSQTYTVVGVNGDVFANCPYITDVTFGSTYRFIGAQAFMGCPITGVSLSPSLQQLGDRAFYQCRQLTSVMIPASVTSIGTGVFADCTVLRSITVQAGNQKYCTDDGVLYTMGKDVLIQWPAAHAVGMSLDNSCVIGSETCPVRVIGDQAFEGCSQLSRITDMYQTVTTIGEKAFYNCGLLSDVKVPATVTMIGKDAFRGCAPGMLIRCDKASAAETYARSNGLATSVMCTVRFYDGSTVVKTEEVPMGQSANAPVLNERSGYTLTWDKDYTNVQQNLDVHASWKQNFTVTFKDAFSGQKTEVVSYYGGTATPPVWTRSGYRLGWDTTAYTYVTKNLTVNAVWLISMTDTPITEEKPVLGETRTINNITYQVTRTSASDPRVCVVGCTKQTLTTLHIPDRITFGGVSYKVTKIGKEAFRDMPRLTSLTVGKYVQIIKGKAFYNCPKLKTVTIKSKKVTGIGEKAFSKTYVKAKVNVPDTLKKKYKKYLLDAGLSIYANIY